MNDELASRLRDLKTSAARSIDLDSVDELDYLLHWYGTDDLITAATAVHDRGMRDEEQALKVGRQLFGAESRFKFMRWLARREEPYFYARQYNDETRDYTQIQFQIRRCVEAGMVAKASHFPATADGRRTFLKLEDNRGGPNPVWWVRLPTKLWQVFDIIEAVMDPDGDGRAAAVLRLATKQRREMVGELRGILDDLGDPKPEPEPVLPFPHNLTPEARERHDRHPAVRITRTKLMEEAHRNGFI